MRTKKPSRKRPRELCAGRADCLAEHCSQWRHDIAETACEGTPLFICGICGAWAEYMVKALGKTCAGSRPRKARTSPKRVLPERRHSVGDSILDCKPRAYVFDPLLHGPSRRTVAVRRLTRRRLAKLEPWMELEEEFTFEVPQVSMGEEENFPSAEE